MSWVAVAVGVAGIGAGLYSSHQANKTAKKGSKDALKSQQDLLKETKPYGAYYSQQGKDALSRVMPYYQSLMSGDRYRTQEALAPELNSIAQKYKGSVSAQRSLYPRGGMSAAKGADLPFQAAGEQTNLMMGSRGEAARSLSGLGTQMAGLGLNAYGLNANISNNLMDYGMQARQYQDQNNAAMGAAFYQAMNGVQGYYANRQTNQTQPLPQGRSVASIYNNGTPGVQGGGSSGVPSNPYQYGGGKP